MVVKTTVPAASKTGRVVGAPSATAPMLLDLKRWGVQQCLWLPGQAGNYASIPDVNLLDANKAHPKSTLADGWVVNDDCVVEPFVGGEGFAGHGVAMRVAGTPDASAGLLQSWSGYREPITAGQTYSIRGLISENIATVPMEMELGLYFYDAATGGGFVGSHWSPLTPLSPTDPVELSSTGAAPAGATHASFLWRVRYQDGTTLTVGDEVILTNFCFRTGADPTFVPSTRIVGDLDVRWNAQNSDLATSQSIVGKYAGANNTFLVHMNPGGVRLYMSDGTTNSSILLSPTVDRENRNEFQITRRVSDGAVTLYENGSVADTGIMNPGASLYVSDTDVTFGAYGTGSAPMRGPFFWSEIRDGIDGPIVASADFTDPNEVVDDNWTTPEGHAASINRRDDATAELVDRNCWATPGDSNLSLNDIPGVNDVDENDFSVIVSVLHRDTTVNGIIATRTTSSAEGHTGWALETYGFRVRTVFDDGPSTQFTYESTKNYNDGEWHLFGLGRWNGQVHVFGNDLIESELATIGSLTTIGELRVMNSANGAFMGLVRFAMIFLRPLTDQERAQLAAWDGSVEQEPSWLRGDPNLVLYLNADDPLTAVNYANGDVIDLRGITHPKNYTKVPLRT